MENSLIALAKSFGINAGLFSLLIIITILFIRREFKNNSETINNLKDNLNNLKKRIDEILCKCDLNYKELDNKYHEISETIVEIKGIKKYLIKKIEDHDKNLKDCFNMIRAIEKSLFKLEIQAQTAIKLTDKVLKDKNAKN